MSAFKRMIPQLRFTLRYYLFLRRQQLVVHLLWDEVKRVFHEDNVHTRRLMLIELVNAEAEKECPGISDPDFLNKSKQEQRAIVAR